MRTVRLLGGAGLLDEGTPIGGPASQRHRIALLALLIADGGRGLSRDKLLAYLWPERDAENGRNLLKVAVHEIRKALGDGAIRTTSDGLAADLTAIASDLGRFNEALARGDDEGAAAAYDGPFLDGFFLRDAAEFEEWATTERQALAKRYAEVMERLAAADESRGDHVAAARRWRVLVHHDQTRAAYTLRLMKALVAAGDVAGALGAAAAHADHRRALLELDADAGVEALATEIHGAAAARSTPAGRRPLGEPVDPPAVPPPRVFGRAPWAGRAAIGAVVVAGVVYYMMVASAPPPPVVRTTAQALVVPFTVVGADPAMRSLGRGVMTLLADRFTGEGSPTAIETPGTPAAADPRGAPSLSSALTLARDADASHLVVGQVVPDAGGIAIDATMYDVGRGRATARARVTTGVAPDPASIDRLAAELLMRVANEPEERVDDVARRPIAAVRTYLEAQSHYHGGRYAVAESLFARSLDFDSTFALSGLYLAMANSWGTITDRYARGRDAAIKWGGRMSMRDRFFTAAFLGPDPALSPPRPEVVHQRAWEDVVEKWRDWPEAWYQLGDRYYHFGWLAGLADPGARARTAFRKALELDSTFGAPLHHLVRLYAENGQTAELRATAERYFALNPSVSRDGSEIGWTVATGIGDKAWLARVRAAMPSMPQSELIRIVWVTQSNGWDFADADRALDALLAKGAVTADREAALRLRYAAAINRGRPSEATAAAVRLGQVFPDRPAGALFELYGALFGDGDSTLADRSARALERFLREPVTGDLVRRGHHHQATCLVGYWRSRRGDLGGARAALAKTRSDIAVEPENSQRRDAGVCAAFLAAELAVRERRGDARSLVAKLDTVLTSERVPPHPVLQAGTLVAAELHERLGDLDAALAASRRREHLGGDPWFLSSQLLVEARLAERLGDRAAAARALRRYIALRQSAEPGTAGLASEAVRELARLERAK